MPKHNPDNRVLLLVAATACWGVGTVITKQALDNFPPLVLLPTQLAASCLMLLIATAARWRRAPGSISRARLRQFGRLGALGVLNPGLAYALALLGLASISASLSVLIWAAEPILILLLAAMLLHERVAASLLGFLAIAVVGVVLVVYQPGVSGDAVGLALTFAAVTACALYTVLTRRLMLDEASLSVVLVQQAAALGFAVVLVSVVRVVGGEPWNVASFSPSDWALAVVSGVIYYGLAFWFYLAALGHLAASIAGAFLPLIPVFGVAAALVAGERLTAFQWVGASLVVAATAAIAASQLRGEAPIPAGNAELPNPTR